MPRKPLRPCRYHNCPNVSEQSYCEQHRKAATRQYDINERNQEMKRFYASGAWRDLRTRKLKQTPLCEECYRLGRLTEAKIVDHILPAKEYPSRRLDITNLQALCAACHNRKHRQSPALENL